MKKIGKQCISVLMLLVYCISVVPAQELLWHNQMHKSYFNEFLSRADLEIEEHKWLEIAEEGLLKALNAWESQRLYIEDTEKDFPQDAYEKFREDLIHEKDRRYSLWLMKKIIDTQKSQKMQDFLKKFNKFKENWQNTAKEKKYSDSQLESAEKLWKDETEAFLTNIQEEQENYFNLDTEIVLQKTNLSAKEKQLLYSSLKETCNIAMEKTYQLLLDETFNSIKHDILYDTESLRVESSKESAEIIGNQILEETIQATDFSQQDLFSSFDDYVATGEEHVISVENKDWTAEFQKKFEAGLALWDKAEKDFLEARDKWEEKLSEVYEEELLAWTHAFEKIRNARQDWEKNILTQLEKGLEKWSEKEEIQKSDIEAAEQKLLQSFEAERKEKIQLMELYGNLYTHSRNLLSEYIQNIQRWYAQWGEKYHNVYSYWKTEDNLGYNTLLTTYIPGLSPDNSQWDNLDPEIILKNYTLDDFVLAFDQWKQAYIQMVNVHQESSIDAELLSSSEILINPEHGLLTLSYAQYQTQNEILTSLFELSSISYADEGDGNLHRSVVDILDLEYQKSLVVFDFWKDEYTIAKDVLDFASVTTSDAETAKITKDNLESSIEQYQELESIYEEMLDKGDKFSGEIEALLQSLETQKELLDVKEREVAENVCELNALLTLRDTTDPQVFKMQIVKTLESMIVRQEENKKAISTDVSDLYKTLVDYENSVKTESKHKIIDMLNKEFNGLSQEKISEIIIDILRLKETLHQENWDQIEIMASVNFLKDKIGFYLPEEISRIEEFCGYIQSKDQYEQLVGKYLLSSLTENILLHFEDEKKFREESLMYLKEGKTPQSWVKEEKKDTVAAQTRNKINNLDISDFEEILKTVNFSGELKERLLSDYRVLCENNVKAEMMGALFREERILNNFGFYDAKTQRSREKQIKNDIEKYIEENKVYEEHDQAEIFKHLEYIKEKINFLEQIGSFTGIYFLSVLTEYVAIKNSKNIDLKETEKKQENLQIQIKKDEELLKLLLSSVEQERWQNYSLLPQNVKAIIEVKEEQEPEAVKNALEQATENLKKSIEKNNIQNAYYSYQLQNFNSVAAFALNRCKELDLLTQEEKESKTSLSTLIYENGLFDFMYEISREELIAWENVFFNTQYNIIYNDDYNNIQDWKDKVKNIAAKIKAYKDFSALDSDFLQNIEFYENSRKSFQEQNVHIESVRLKVLNSDNEHATLVREYEKIYSKLNEVKEKYMILLDESQEFQKKLRQAKIENRIAQEKYDWAVSVYLGNFGDKNAVSYKTPLENFYEKEFYLNRQEKIVALMKKTRNTKAVSHENYEKQLELYKKLFTDKNLLESLQEKISASVAKDKNNLKKLQRTEDVYRQKIFVPISEEIFPSFVDSNPVLKAFVFEKTNSNTFSVKLSDTEHTDKALLKEYFVDKNQQSVVSKQQVVVSEEIILTFAEREAQQWINNIYSKGENYVNDLLLASVYLKNTHSILKKECVWNFDISDNDLFSLGHLTSSDFVHGLPFIDEYHNARLEVVRDAYEKIIKSKADAENLIKYILYSNTILQNQENWLNQEKKLVESRALEIVSQKISEEANKQENIGIAALAVASQTLVCSFIPVVGFFFGAATAMSSAVAITAFDAAKSLNSVKKDVLSLRDGKMALVEESNRDIQSMLQEWNSNSLELQKVETKLKEFLKSDAKTFSYEAFCMSIQQYLGMSRENFNQNWGRVLTKSFFKKNNAGNTTGTLLNMCNDYDTKVSQQKELLEKEVTILSDTHNKQVERYNNFIADFLTIPQDSFIRLQTLSEKAADPQLSVEERRRAEEDYKKLYSQLNTVTPKQEKELAKIISQTWYENYWDGSIHLQNLHTFYKECMFNNIDISSKEEEQTKEIKEHIMVNSLEYLKKRQQLTFEKEQFILQMGKKDLQNQRWTWENQIKALLDVAKTKWQQTEEKLNGQFFLWNKKFNSRLTEKEAQWQKTYTDFLIQKENWIQRSYSNSLLQGMKMDFDVPNFDIFENLFDKETLQVSDEGVKEIERVVSETLDDPFFKEYLYYTTPVFNRNPITEKISDFRNFHVNPGSFKTKGEIIEKQLQNEIRNWETREILNQAENLLKEILNSYLDQIDESNTDAKKWQEKLVLDHGYKIDESIYRQATVHATLLNPIRETQFIHKYEFFIPELPTPFDFSKMSYSFMSHTPIMAIIEQEKNNLLKWSKSVFGETTEDAKENIQGALQKHIGTSPEFISDFSNVQKKEDILKTAGSGEMGKILLDFVWNDFVAQKGFGELSKPGYEKSLFDDRNSFFKAPTLKGIIDIALNVVGNITGQGWWLNSIDDVFFLGLGYGGKYISEKDFLQGLGTQALGLMKTSAMGVNGWGTKIMDKTSIQWLKDSKIVSSLLKNGRHDLYSGLFSSKFMTNMQENSFLSFVSGAFVEGGYSYLSSVGKSYLQGINWSKIGTKDWYNADIGNNSWTAGETWANMVRSSITGGLDNVNFRDSLGINLSSNMVTNLSSVRNFNDIMGSLGYTATKWGITGQMSLNLLNFGNTGLLELSIDKNGATMGLGMNGENFDVRYGINALKGVSESQKIMDWKYTDNTNSVLFTASNLLAHSTGCLTNKEVASGIYTKEIQVTTTDRDDIYGKYDTDTRIIEINKNLFNKDKNTIAKFSSVLSHEGSHYFGNRKEAIAHISGAITYREVTDKLNIKMDQNFYKGIETALFDEVSLKENSGNEDFWRIPIYSDGTHGPVQIEYDENGRIIKDLHLEYIHLNENGEKELIKVVTIEDTTESVAASLTRAVGLERANELLNSELSNTELYDMQTLTDVLGVSREEAEKIKLKGHLPENISELQLYKLAGESLLKTRGFTYSPETGWTGGSLDDITLTNNKTMGYILFAPKERKNNPTLEIDRFVVTSTLYRNARSFDGYMLGSNGVPGEKLFTQYAGLDLPEDERLAQMALENRGMDQLVFKKYDLKNNLLSEHTVRGVQSVDVFVNRKNNKGEIIEDRDQQYYHSVYGNVQGNTVVSDFSLTVQMGRFGENDLSVCLITNATTMDGDWIDAQGVDGDPGGSWLIHTSNYLASDGCFIMLKGEAERLINFFEEIGLKNGDLIAGTIHQPIEKKRHTEPKYFHCLP